jgi:methylated-DNA-[protein]-cysteine S-methyltransferase
MDSPIGELTLLANDEGLVGIDWNDDTDHHTAATDGDVTDVDADENDTLRRTVEQLDEYFAGTRTAFDVPLAAPGTTFQHQAWNALVRIPYGETVSYGEQAVMLGDKNKARAVGAANGKNPIPIIVPCHRVVGSNGHLTGFAGGLDTKAWLLDHEFKVRAAG